MNLSVAFTFEPGIIPRLAAFHKVKEIYGKLYKDPAGKHFYPTYKQRSPKALKIAAQEAHSYGIGFNYLLDGANFNGLEQNRSSLKKLRTFLDFLRKSEVDSVTVSAPFLLRLLKNRYPGFKVQVGTSAQICTALAARQWEDMGADTLVINPVSTNRNFEALSSIRAAVNCELKLVANAFCLLNCIFQNSHLQHPYRRAFFSDQLKYILDYSFLHCTMRRIQNPANLIRSCWIRPEDISFYENLGYSSFKIIEQNCPGNLLIKRVKAYTKRSFNGNLMEIIGPVAPVREIPFTSFVSRLCSLFNLTRPGKINPSLIALIYKYLAWLNPAENSLYPLIIRNKRLDGFIENIAQKKCGSIPCSRCNYCANVATKVVQIDTEFRHKIVNLVQQLDSGL